MSSNQNLQSQHPKNSNALCILPYMQRSRKYSSKPEKKSININRHRNHTDDKTSWLKCQNCYKYTPNVREDREKHECNEERNTGYKKRYN